MDPVSAIVAALVAGAIAAASKTAGNAVEDAYAGLKKILADGYKFASTALLDKDPSSATHQEAVLSELNDKPAIVADPVVTEKVQVLTEALRQVPPRNLAAWGIDIRSLKASGDVAVDNVKGTAGGVKGEEWVSGGSVRLSNVTGGSAPSGN